MTEETSAYSVLVTGANSGLGLAICTRLIDEFLFTRPQSQCLLLIPTTRSRSKCDATVKILRRHLDKVVKEQKKNPSPRADVLERRVRFQPEVVDLCSFHTIRDLARTLQHERGMRKLDVAIFNAGIGGWTGVDFFWAVREILTDFPYSVTFPVYKMSEAGRLLQRQLPLQSESFAKDEPRTGEIFAANVLGHYMLARWLAPLMSRSKVGRDIWVSSLESYHDLFHADDFQGIQNKKSYESTKRITDALAVTSRLPSTASWVDVFFEGPKELQMEAKKDESTQQPQMYVCHPGIVATGIMPLNIVFTFLMYAAFYVARWVGSMWHCISAYKGAVAPVWLALASQELLDRAEDQHGVGKWGSSTDRAGEERVERTEVESWGYGGIAGDASRFKRAKGRVRGSKDLTNDEREKFEEFGRSCWKEMERIRVEWEEQLDSHSL